MVSGTGGTCPCPPDALSWAVLCVCVWGVPLVSSPPSFKGASLVAQTVRNLPANAGDSDSISGSGKSPGKGNGNPLRYSCLENPTNRGAWWATVHGAAKELDTTERLTNNSSFKQRRQLGSSKWEHLPRPSSGVTIQPHSCICPNSFSRVNMAKG